jgi:hypothetical protein
MPGLLLTQIEAGKLLGRNPRIIRRWTRAGLLPVFVDPDSRKVLYPKPALERWAASAAEMAEAS